MARANSNLTAGTATSGGRRRSQKGRRRPLAGIVTIAALGLSLLAGLAFAQSRPTTQPATSVAPATITSANCADDAARCPAWNAGALTSLPTADPFTYREDHRAAGVRPDITAPSQQTDRATFTPGPFTYREDHRADPPLDRDCVFAGVAGEPGEGCTRR